MLGRFGISSTTTMPAYRLELAITTYLPLPTAGSSGSIAAPRVNQWRGSSRAEHETGQELSGSLSPKAPASPGLWRGH